MNDDQPGQYDAAAPRRVVYVAGAALGVLLLLTIALAILLTRPDDDDTSAGEDMLRASSAPTSTPRPTSTPFQGPMVVTSTTTPTPASPPTQILPVPTIMMPTPPGETATPEPPASEVDWSVERHCRADDEVLLEAEGSVRSWVRNEQGQYAVYNISMLTDEIIEAGEIENVDYDRDDRGESYSLYDEGSFEAYFEVVNLGSPEIRISTYQDVITGRALFLPVVEAGATLRITFARDSDPASLRLLIDDDGDGEIDREMEPDGAVTGRAACETVDPSFRAEVSEPEPGVAEVTLIGEDNEGGSGIGGIFYYLFDDVADTRPTAGNVQRPQRYSEPIRMDRGGMVLFLGWDNAGNRTIWQDVVVLGGFGPDVTGTLVVGGDPVPIETPLPGQNAMLTFDGRAGQRIVAVLSDNTYGQTPLHIAGYLRVIDPAGEVIASSGSFGSLDKELEVTLEVDGAHTLMIDPFATTTGGGTVTLHASMTIEGTIAPGGAPVTLALTDPGQEARLTFDGSAGQRLAIDAIVTRITSEDCLGIDESSRWENPCALVIRMRSPNGENVVTLPGIDERGNQTETVTLPVTGVYTLTVAPLQLMMGVVDVRLLTFEASAALVDGGTPIAVTMDSPGEVVSLGIDGEAQQTYLVTISNVDASRSDCCVALYSVLTPAGVLSEYGADKVFENDPNGLHTVPETGTYASPWNKGLPRTAFVGIDGTEFLMSTPEAGRYTLVVDMYENTTGSFTVSIQKLDPVKVEATTNGLPVDLEIEYSEQPAIVEFTGIAGQRVTFTARTTLESEFNIDGTRFRLFAPDGEVLYDDRGEDWTWTTFTVTIPADGTYWLELFNLSGDVAWVSVAVIAQ